MNHKLKIPWAKPDIQKKDQNAVLRVLKTNWLTMGPEVKKFEYNISRYLNVNYGVAVNSGTSALDVALKCINITKDDKVIIPALTYIATGNVILYNGATPVFIDIDDTFNIDPELIEEKITDSTKAIINIDFGGNPANYNQLMKLSKRYNIPLIVDGANSFGSEYHGKKCCTHGLINTTSFHAAKILTTIEGGMVFTNKKTIFSQAKAIRQQGETSKYTPKYLGNNYRMMDIVAAIGNSQIKRFKNTLQIRKEKAEYYKKHLKNVDFPKQLNNTIHSYFFFLILTKKRDKLYNYLKKNGIDTRITYPKPMNEQAMFRCYSQETYPMAKALSKKVLSLPLYHSLTQSQQDFIIKKINNFLK